MSYSNSIHINDNGDYIELYHRNHKATDGTTLYTLSLHVKGSTHDSVIYMDMPEGRLTDLQNLIEEGLNSPKDEDE